jgi:hypothetical protein
MCRHQNPTPSVLRLGWRLLFQHLLCHHILSIKTLHVIDRRATMVKVITSSDGHGLADAAVRVMIMNIKKGQESERHDEVVPANEQTSILDVLNFKLRAQPVAQ